MRTVLGFIGVLCIAIAFGAAGAAENHHAVGPGHGITLPSGDDNPCPGAATLLLNYDGTAENGYCWDYGGTVPPYYGAFAECYRWSGHVCGIELLLTGIGYPCYPVDLYIWEDASGMPGNVLEVTRDADPCPVAIWPNISTHDFAVACLDVDGPFWTGYWSDNSNHPCGNFVAADLDGPGTCPFTDIAPGIGYPTGWNNVSVVWGSTSAVGVGTWVQEGPCNPVPTQEGSWGHIKEMYR